MAQSTIEQDRRRAETVDTKSAVAAQGYSSNIMDTNMNKKQNDEVETKPLVTIITASYNSSQYLSASIESALAQTYKNWELIILDDASADNTETLAIEYIKKDSRIQYFRQSKNLGIAGNRNTGFEKARGKYLAILDSDDMWIDPEKLEKQVSFLEKNPEYGLIGTWAKKVDGNGKDIGNMSFFADDKNIRKHILRRHQFVDSSSVFSPKRRWISKDTIPAMR